jgi:predicted N-acetyltransferase YhbS
MPEPIQRHLPPVAPADVDFRAMQPGDIESGLQLCRLAGWDQVQRDWERFISDENATVSLAIYPKTQSPSSSSSGVEARQIIGTVATIRYGAEFGWIGMLLVHPDVQGRGVGAVLLGHATAELAGVPSIRLDATPAGHILYRKHGFVDEFPLRRMEATSVVIERSQHSSIAPLKHADLAEVVAFDRPAFGAPRADVLAWMLDGAPACGFVARRGGQVVGYVVGRDGHEFNHLGPIVAVDASLAVELARTCLAVRPGKAVVIDSASDAAEWRSFLEQAGFHEQRPYIRMYRGGTPTLSSKSQQFAILGPEFG